MTDDYDLAVVGGGAAGLVAAREAIQHGASVLLVEAARLGGDCTWTGCVPSKALIAAANRGDDFDAAMISVRRAVHQIAATEDETSLKAEGIEVRLAHATLVAPGVLDVGGERVTARHVVLATGSRPTRPAVAGLGKVSYLSNETIFDLSGQPSSLAILGGGAVGCELAQAFTRLGTQVVVIEAADRLLPREEPEASATIAEALVADGAEVRTGCTIRQATPGQAPGSARLDLDDGGTIDADALLVAVGRTPNTEDLGLEGIGVQLDAAGFVRTDATRATTLRRTWAVGDVTGRLPFTHAGAHMAYVAVGNALAAQRPRRLRRRRRFDPAAIPLVTFTDPEVGRVGVTEAETERSGATGARVAYLPLS